MERKWIKFEFGKYCLLRQIGITFSYEKVDKEAEDYGWQQCNHAHIFIDLLIWNLTISFMDFE